MKKVILLISILMIFSTICVYALPLSNIDNPDTPPNVSEIRILEGKIWGGFQAGGYIISVAVLLYIGIRMMIASPGEKANLKTMMVPYLVGAVILFSTSSILAIIKAIGLKMTV